MTVEPGLRARRLRHQRRATTLSPRLRATLARSDRATRLRAGAGRYTQSPGYEKLIQSDYFVDLSHRALDLDSERARARGAGPRARSARRARSRASRATTRASTGSSSAGLETEAERQARIAHYDFPPRCSSRSRPSASSRARPTTAAGAGLRDRRLPRRAAARGSPDGRRTRSGMAQRDGLRPHVRVRLRPAPLRHRWWGATASRRGSRSRPPRAPPPVFRARRSRECACRHRARRAVRAGARSARAGSSTKRSRRPRHPEFRAAAVLRPRRPPRDLPPARPPGALAVLRRGHQRAAAQERLRHRRDRSSTTRPPTAPGWSRRRRTACRSCRRSGCASGSDRGEAPRRRSAWYSSARSFAWSSSPAFGQELREVHDHELLLGVDPIGRVVGAAPAVLADGAGDAAQAHVLHDREAEAEPAAGLGLQRADVVHRHQLDRLAAEDARPSSSPPLSIICRKRA